MNGTSTSKCLVSAFKSVDLTPTITLHLSKTTLKWPQNGRVPRHSKASCSQKVGGRSEGGRLLLKGWQGSSQQDRRTCNPQWDLRCGQKVSQHSSRKPLNSGQLRPEQECVVKPQMGPSCQAGELRPLATGKRGPGYYNKYMAWFNQLHGKGETEISHCYEDWHLQEEAWLEVNRQVSCQNLKLSAIYQEHTFIQVQLLLE